MTLKPPSAPTDPVVFDRDVLTITSNAIGKSVESYGADATGSGDSTAAFVAARQAAGPGGKILVGHGTFKIKDFDLAGGVVSPDGAVGYTLEGLGPAYSRIIPATGSTYVTQLDCSYGSMIRDIAINNPNSVANVDGVRILGTNTQATSQGNALERVWIRDQTRGIYVLGGGAGSPPSDQNDKITYKDVRVDRCTTGYEVWTRNGQNQLWLGGSINQCTIAVKLGGASMTWIGGQIQRTATSGGTAFQFTDNTTLCLTLKDFICELVDVAFDEQTSIWPEMGVIIEGGSVIQARTKFASIPAGKSMTLRESVLRGANSSQPGGPAVGDVTLYGAGSWLRDENGKIENEYGSGHNDARVVVSALGSRYEKIRSTQPATYCMAGFIADDIQSLTLGTLPPKSLILELGCNVLEAFNSSGTDNITVGGTGNSTRYAAASDVSSTGLVTFAAGSSITPPPPGSATVAPALQTTGDIVTVAYANGGTEPTTGKALVWMKYTIIGPTPT